MERGFDMFKDLDWFFNPTQSGKISRYPLTNFGVNKDEVLIIEIAVAGFYDDELSVDMKGNQLIITGTKDVENTEIQYFQKHISDSSFVRSMVLHENYVNGDVQANLQNGILTIQVKPKEKQKKTIKITSNQK